VVPPPRPSPPPEWIPRGMAPVPPHYDDSRRQGPGFYQVAAAEAAHSTQGQTPMWSQQPYRGPGSVNPPVYGGSGGGGGGGGGGWPGQGTAPVRIPGDSRHVSFAGGPRCVCTLPSAAAFLQSG
jgi:hypothetical protein